MVFTGSERNTAVRLPTAEPTPETAVERRERPAVSTLSTLVFAMILGAFWIGAAAMYALGYFGGTAGILALPIYQLTLLAVAIFLPPMLILMTAWTFTRGQAMAAATESLVEATDRLFSTDETAARTAARLGRSVRRELDALNTGIDGAFTRLRALESVWQTQIAALDEASARAEVRTGAVADRLGSDRQQLDAMTAGITESATRATELVASKAAQLKSLVEAAEATLKSAGQLLETQAGTFRAATETAAQAPHRAAVELDKQAKHIESISDAAVSRAEFVLGRHERHRVAMAEQLQRLHDQSQLVEHALLKQCAALDHAIGALSGQAKLFETMAAETGRQLETIMSAGSARATELATNFGREATHVKEISENSGAALVKLVAALRDAGSGAQALIGETSAQANTSAKALVGEAMAECQNLVKTAAELADQANMIKAALGGTISEIHQHLLSLPAMAQQESARVREMVRTETEEMLNISARTISTIHARSSGRVAPRAAEAAPEPEPEAQNEGLLGLARKLAQRPRRKEKEKESGEPKSWQMSTLLSAVDSTGGKQQDLKPGAAAALGALEAALADIAVDLDAINVGGAPSDEDWRRYLAGDRAVFARRIADGIDEAAMARITTLNRESTRFREAANSYMEEFEALLERARQGDNGGLLASTMLSADTGKIYLAIAYALGRLSH
ncbi:MAG TPA: hypothetical protein VHU18_14540 [Rhizomicrobium sp.]|nr:hypothetical protein [Rhizomicrobium sp.]